MKKTVRFTCLLLMIGSIAGFGSCNPNNEEIPEIPVTPVAPAVPTELAVEDLQTTSAILKWNGEATAYEVVIDDGEAELVTVKSYTAKNLTAETDYRWKVRAVDGELSSEWVSGPAFTTEPEDVVTPDPIDAPTGLVVSNVTATSAVFVWEGTTTSYEIEVGGTKKVVKAKTFTVKYLTIETDYEWRVRAVDGDSSSEWVAGESFTTEGYVFTKGHFEAWGDIANGLKNWYLRLYDEGQVNTGTGIGLYLDLYATGDSDSIIADGTYTVGNSGNTAWEIYNYYSVAEAFQDYVPNPNKHDFSGGTATITNIGGDNYSIVLDIEAKGLGTINTTYTGPLTFQLMEGAPMGCTAYIY